MQKTHHAAPPVLRDRSRAAAEALWRHATIWFVAITSLLIANRAWAAGRSVNVVLMVEGTDADAVRRELNDALPPRFNLQDPDTTKAALSKEGVMGSFADSLSNKRVRTQALGAVHKSLKQQGVPALIAVRTRRGRNNARETRVILVTSEQVEPVVEEDITLGRNEKLGNKVGPLLAVPLEDIEAANEKAVAAAPKTGAGAGAAAAAPVADKPTKRPRADAATEPPPAAEASRDKEKDKDRDRDEPPPSTSAAAMSADNDAPERDTAVKKKREKVSFTNAMILVDLGAEVGSRRMAYSDPLVGPLRAYLAPGVVGYGFAGQFYPGASSGTPFAKDIGVVFRYAGSLPFESTTKDGSQKATGSWTRTAIGVRGRFLAGSKASGPYIGVEGTYGTWSFVFEGDEPIVAEVPSVRYKYVRGAVDARFPFNALSLTVQAGGMYVMSAGEFTDRFPHSSIAGVDGTATLAYAFLPWLEGRVGANYTRIFSSAKPERGDTYIAGGALDEYFIFHGGIAAAF